MLKAPSDQSRHAWQLAARAGPAPPAVLQAWWPYLCRLHAVPCSWRGGVCLAPRHKASFKHLGASQHSLGPQVAVANTRSSAFLSVRAKQEPPPRVQQGQRQPQPQPSSWSHLCEQVAAFQQQHGRLPLASGDAQGPLLPGERPLGCGAQSSSGARQAARSRP